jgi:hypothetical protein
MLLDESLYYFFLIVKERQPIRALNCAHTALTGSIANAKGSASRRTLCIEDWWRMTGSNRRPPACKAGALPAELIPQSHTQGGIARQTSWWVWMDSNHRPPPYQDGALTD